MNRRFKTMAVAVMLFLAMLFTIEAKAGDIGAQRTTLPHLGAVCPTLMVEHFLPDGSNWEGCPVDESTLPSNQSWKLCAESAKQIDTATFRQLRDLLFEKTLTAQELCGIEAALIESLDDCVIGKLIGMGSFVELTSKLAANWIRLERLDRAERLYLLAYQLLREGGWPSTDVMRTLQGLTDVQLKKGQNNCAVKLAQLQTDFARIWYEKKRFISAMLTDSLVFQAEVLEQLDRYTEAGSLREEAAAIEAAHPCDQDGVCEDTGVVKILDGESKPPNP